MAALACRYTCEGCNRAVPRAMWEDDQCWATDSSEFYCYDCWEEWTTKQGGKQGSVVRQHTASKAARLNGTCVMYWVKIDSDLYSLDLRRDHYLDRAMYEGGGSPMKRGTWVFLCGVE